MPHIFLWLDFRVQMLEQRLGSVVWMPREARIFHDQILRDIGKICGPGPQPPKGNFQGKVIDLEGEIAVLAVQVLEFLWT